MTINDVRNRIIDIAERAQKDDDDGAHSREDDLYRGVLEAIANGSQDPISLAREALKTRKILFSRWTA